MVVKTLIIAVFLLGVAWAQSDAEPSKTEEKIFDSLGGKVDKDQVEDIKNKTTAVFKDKCERNGGSDAFGNAENALKNLKTCMEGLVDQTLLEREIEEAKPNGRIDEVFKKYCAKKPQFKNCFKEAVEAAKPCFTSDEQRNLKIVYNVTEQLAEFVCFKDGDRIALFIAEGGPECYQEKQEAIQGCVNTTLGSDVQFNANNISADTIPEIKFTSKECGQLSDLQACVVSSLESCAQPTTANIVESLFKFIRKATPCKDFNENVASPRNTNVEPTAGKTQAKPDSASGLAVTSLTLVLAVASLLV